jgi:hypothetical protein
LIGLELGTDEEDLGVRWCCSVLLIGRLVVVVNGEICVTEYTFKVDSCE